MKLRNLKIKLSRTAIVGATMIVSITAALAPASQAFAAYPPIHICMSQASSTCVITNGQGNQVMVSSTVYPATFTLTQVGTSIWYRLTDANGHCLRETSSNAVEIGNGNCNPNDLDAQWDWFTTGTGNNMVNKLRNRGQDSGNDYMGTYGTEDGKPVWAHPEASGFYTGWLFPEV